MCSSTRVRRQKILVLLLGDVDHEEEKRDDLDWVDDWWWQVEMRETERCKVKC